MSVPVKLAGFAAVLAAVFGVAFLTGTQSAALLAPPPVAHPAVLGGLTASADGYTLTAVTPELEPGPGQQVPVRLTGPVNAPVHLVALRRDLTGFQHHELSVTGATWSVALDLTPGPWRVVVEVQPSALGQPVLLGVDLTVRGTYRPAPPPAPAEAVEVAGEAYAVLVRPADLALAHLHHDGAASTLDLGRPEPGTYAVLVASDHDGRPAAAYTVEVPR